MSDSICVVLGRGGGVRVGGGCSVCSSQDHDMHSQNCLLILPLCVMFSLTAAYSLNFLVLFNYWSFNQPDLKNTLVKCSIWIPTISDLVLFQRWFDWKQPQILQWSVKRDLLCQNVVALSFSQCNRVEPYIVKIQPLYYIYICVYVQVGTSHHTK